MHNVLKLITRGESLKSNSSQESRASGKPDAVFSSRSNETGNQLESFLFSNMLIFLKGTKILSPVRQDLKFLKREHQVASLNNYIFELQQ